MRKLWVLSLQRDVQNLKIQKADNSKISGLEGQISVLSSDVRIEQIINQKDKALSELESKIKVARTELQTLAVAKGLAIKNLMAKKNELDRFKKELMQNVQEVKQSLSQFDTVNAEISTEVKLI